MRGCDDRNPTQPTRKVKGWMSDEDLCLQTGRDGDLVIRALSSASYRAAGREAGRFMYCR